jgi:23S rRNA pseudouridine1911/1915/1917 synthase
MEHVVGPEAAGERLDVFLAPHVGSRAAAQKLIDAGLVLVDGEARAKRHAVNAGERITVQAAPEVPEVEVPDAQFAVAYEDEHLLVVDKPAGVVVHPDRAPARPRHVRAAGGRP